MELSQGSRSSQIITKKNPINYLLLSIYLFFAMINSNNNYIIIPDQQH